MRKIILSANSYISITLKLLMLGAVFYFFIKGNFVMGPFALVSLGISLIPAVVNHNYKVNLPWQFDFWLTLWMALQIFGEVGLYDYFPWWDIMLHFGGSAIFAYLAFFLVYAFNYVGKLRLSIPFIGFFTFLIAVAFGAIWEIMEFWVWKLTGQDALAMNGSIINGFYDTFSDLQLDTLGATLVAVFAMKYVARKRHITFHEWIKPFVKIFGKKIKKAKKIVKGEKKKMKAKIQKSKNIIKKSLK